MSTQPKSDFQRQVFTTSRELEYFSEAELVTQTGYDREHWWPGVLVKELVDNSLDACEQAGVQPDVRVYFTGGALAVCDNGPGLPPEVIARILDFSTRTSDKAEYVSPTRGAQGNALKTVLAIPFVLSGGSPGTVVIETCGLRHLITISTDHVARRPQIEHRSAAIVKTTGTTIRIPHNSACSKTTTEETGFLQRLLFDYSLFNPHANLGLHYDGDQHWFPATTGNWQKWRPSDATPPHWYSVEKFEDLVASYVSAERTGGRARTVREFVSEFRGLAGTLKQKAVVARAGLDRAYLHDLIRPHGKLDRSALQRLLGLMQGASTPVKPEMLGVLGEDHFRRRLLIEEGDNKSFRYRRIKGTGVDGLPYIVECAFSMMNDPLRRGAHVGLNWSVPLDNPLQQDEFVLGDGETAWGFAALLAKSRISLDRDPVCLVVHLICPRFRFLDRGKGSVSLTFADAVAKAVLDVTKEWAAIKKKRERDQKQAERMKERY